MGLEQDTIETLSVLRCNITSPSKAAFTRYNRDATALDWRRETSGGTLLSTCKAPTGKVQRGETGSPVRGDGQGRATSNLRTSLPAATPEGR